MPSLKQAAAAANIARTREHQEDKRQKRERELSGVIETLTSNGYGGLAKRFGDEYADALPERGAFTYRSIETDLFRVGTLYGWAFEIDEVPFIYITSHGHQGLNVILTCPDCQVERADSVSGLPELGRKLAKQQSIHHKCLDTETRNVAHAIGTAARDLKMRPDEVVEIALRRHMDVIARVMTR